RPRPPSRPSARAFDHRGTTHATHTRRAHRPGFARLRRLGVDGGGTPAGPVAGLRSGQRGGRTGRPSRTTGVRGPPRGPPGRSTAAMASAFLATSSSVTRYGGIV